MYKNRLLALTVCIALSLVGGVAWAATTQSIELPSGTSGVDAVLIPGGSGGSVVLFGGYWVEEIDLKVDFDPSGTLSINGEAVASVTLEHCHSVHIDLFETGTGHMALVTVTDNCANVVVCPAFSVGLGVDAPQEATATGSEVIDVSAG